MKNTKKIRDNQLVLLEALIRYSDLSGSTSPHFYKDQMMETLGVCEHVFNIMHKQLGDTCCRLVDCFGDRSRYVINVNRCLERHDQIIQANERDKRQRKAIRNTLLMTSMGAFFVILFGCCII
ncbi:MAG TPA: hypothetical protein PLU81_12000 [Deltaproteobacteria bacterium]|nr:hypothetical protein [Deltaproteobacteria bacterium]HPJ95208.1 hypothetical protein [Deltaproteobacteria bacterium]HPR52505.1 hypothetical protein [Deltaproteobacteria bacterium]